MCGITGFIDFENRTSDEILDYMVQSLDHRGPDSSGKEIFKSKNALIGLGHTRLSILDLSPAGHQPMKHENFSIVFNGEIYNFREIKSELEKSGHHFKSNSDTEVILHAFQEWNVKCVDRFIGMFAFVIFDHSDNKLYAFRDRAGVKPFFYYVTNELFLFGSELKSLNRHPNFDKKIDKRALKIFFNFGYISSPYSIFENTYKLEPGNYLVYDTISKELEINSYWEAAKSYKQPKLTISYKEAKDQLHDLLKSAFQYRMVSDVPVGVFLSGGYDSTAVTAILQADSEKKIKTFTIGFEQGNNEAPMARQTADFLGTDHHEMICTESEAKKIIPNLPRIYDEPFADSSAIPTTLLSQFASNHVKVALSADAGDELFAGYNSYPSLREKLRLLNYIPANIKQTSRNAFKSAYELIPENYPALKHKVYGISNSLNSDRIQQSADLFRIANSLPAFYMNALFNDNEEKTDDYVTDFSASSSGFHDEIEIAMAVDYISYLQNDILTKVDRATMSHSLEGREPFLDQRLLEFAARIPLSYKLNGDKSKRILRDIVHEYIPEKLMDRPKSGFSVPIYDWLQSDLNYLLKEYLNERELRKSGLFNVNFVLSKVDDFNHNRLHYSTFIWKLLMFQMWYREWME
ncbi:asparagine synthase (glutamine-hydrolyzing) [soil metagenome]